MNSPANVCDIHGRKRGRLTTSTRQLLGVIETHNKGKWKEQKCFRLPFQFTVFVRWRCRILQVKEGNKIFINFQLMEHKNKPKAFFCYARLTSKKTNLINFCIVSRIQYKANGPFLNKMDRVKTPDARQNEIDKIQSTKYAWQNWRRLQPRNTSPCFGVYNLSWEGSLSQRWSLWNQNRPGLRSTQRKASTSIVLFIGFLVDKVTTHLWMTNRFL